MKYSSRGRVASDSPAHHSASITFRYPLEVQNLLPLELRVVERKGKEERTIRPGDTVHFSGVGMEDEPTFQTTVCDTT